ncbi:MAG TPA: FAD-binding oxidoreductase, partial [bacterium]|nr:FAD-binding oxidoreductase [bacterium]
MNNRSSISKVQRVLYSTDISMFECVPKKIYYPKNKQELQKILIKAKKNKITIHPRGCGTSTAGQSLGHGVLIDTARYMNRILHIGKDYVDVEPGIILEELNKKLKPFGLFMPVDPSSHEVCSIGGMVSNNSSGIHSYLYGDTKDYVIGIEGYFANTDSFSTISGEGTKKYLDIISSIKPKALALTDKIAKSSKNSSGYNIKDTFSKNGLTALNSLLIGSEGTLCVMTKIRLKVIPLPEKRITILATFDDLEKALLAVSASKKINNISAIELLDKELIATSRKYFTEIRNFFSDDINAGLIFEIDGTEKNTQNSLKELLQVLEPVAKKIETGYNEEERKKLWWMRKSASSILNRIEGSTRSL